MRGAERLHRELVKIARAKNSHVLTWRDIERAGARAGIQPHHLEALVEELWYQRILWKTGRYYILVRW